MALPTGNNKTLPQSMKDFKLDGTIGEHIARARTSCAHLSDTPFQGSYAATGTPVLQSTPDVMSAYQQSDFATISALQTTAQNDLQPIYTNISTLGSSAWTPVTTTLPDGSNATLYVSWAGSNGSYVVSYTSGVTEIQATGDDPTYQAEVQIGIYSATGSIAGIHTYNITIPTLAVAAAAALVVGVAISGAIAYGLGFAVSVVTNLMVTVATEVFGIEEISFAVSASAVGGLAIMIGFAIVFIGLMYLWNYINRQYTIRVQVFNWDQGSVWQSLGWALQNAKIPGADSDALIYNIPAALPAGSRPPIPGTNWTTLTASVSYVPIIFMNEKTYMGGCEMAITHGRQADGTGFTWGFSCPRTSDNEQAGVPGTIDAEEFLNNPPWNDHPEGFIINTPSGTPVTFSLDGLSGRSDGTYNSYIHIDNPNPPELPPA
ncbi:hypothetical protein NYR97_11395 [Xanthomonas hydrangeae]|uniref:Uncharacterized protein n=1 Tax=Xanthomonas hydrangeae TaxID=2775159 RepID=A0AAU0B7B6_9XANT|nr:hypothetical protein [Xanthomonas hydrangeae]WOB47900.1 hypothetical protein NYR97_11395 [Xanthomonas hydrangeae]